MAKDATHRDYCLLLENMPKTKYGSEEDIQPQHADKR
jgi:hypothetical protein